MSLIFDLEVLTVQQKRIKTQEVYVGCSLVLTSHNSGLLSPAELLAPLAWHQCPTDWSLAVVTGSLSVEVGSRN